jgi:hypothetical protein
MFAVSRYLRHRSTERAMALFLVVEITSFAAIQYILYRIANMLLDFNAPPV